MKLTWHGHSCFTLESTDGTLAFDTFLDNYVPGISPVRLLADRLLSSHRHGDHYAPEVVSLTGHSFAGTIEELATFHDPEQGALRGPNTIHIITTEGLRLAHLGDLGCTPTPEQLEQLKGLDVMLIPIGGFYTIDPTQARALVESVAPRVVIPMHYRSDAFGFDVLATVEDYLALCQDAVFYPGNTIEVTTTTPAQTAVLTYCSN